MRAMRIAALIEYDGSQFSGWQLQAADPQRGEVRTVQAVVEQALGAVAAAPVRVHVAGRTDAGVHAAVQVVHFDSDAKRTPYAWVRGGNTHLPNDVALLWAQPVAADFHARFSASARTYRYVVLNRATRPALAHTRVSWEYRPLEVARMRAAAALLVGMHDFSSYRAVQCQAKSPIRELRVLDVTRHGDYVVITATANAFLHHMVRNLAGVLLDIGAGEREPQWAQEILHARDRTAGGVTAPAAGLYLTGIEYPARFAIPSAQARDEFWF